MLVFQSIWLLQTQMDDIQHCAAEYKTPIELKNAGVAWDTTTNTSQTETQTQAQTIHIDN